MNGGLTYLIIIIVIVVIWISFYSGNKGEYYSSNQGWGSSESSGCYDNIAGYSYQNYPASTRAEVNYTSDVLGNCYGPEDTQCLGKQHLRTFREGMDYKDVADWVCGPQCKTKTSAEYYNCLNQVYTDYKFP
ncbi:hypothetical protein OAG24_00110 [bacterium]|nr:hypothetical protein [bacterium]